LKRVKIDDRSAADIDRIVTKLHRDIGNQTGPVDLAAVRTILRLDLRYYQSSDSGLVREVLHKLTMGAKQVVHRPMLLLDAVRTFNLRALILPDRKQILLDKDQPALKLRWHEAHEVAHGFIPWHPAYALGDDRRTLSPQCQETIEAEANWGAGRLLFPNATFAAMSRDSPPSIQLVSRLAKHFGNTITTTLWRFVEQSDRAMFGIVGEHPHHPRDGEPVVAHFVESDRFSKEFQEISDEFLVAAVKSYCSYKKSGPLGRGTVELADTNGGRRTFMLESFSNSYQCLTLGLELQVGGA